MSLNPLEVPAWLRQPGAGFLSPKQIAMLDALFERILPADHARQIPGAVDAAASTFVSLLLARDPAVYWEIPAWRTLYTKGLTALEAYSRAAHDLPLVQLGDKGILDLLAQLEIGSLPGVPPEIDQKLLFTTLRRHCIQGCFADPRWGGNPGRIMWRAIGYQQPAEDLFP